MLNFKKLMSLFLAVLMLCGALTGLSVVTVSADEATDQTTPTTPDKEEDEDTPEKRTEKYHTTKYKSPQEKLATMKKMSTKGNYSIYADQKSGEVAVEDLATGQILFTNPYDIGYSNATTNVKNELMSQIIVTFTEVGSDNKKDYTSFEYAAAKDQIKVKNIKNGIHVEYTIGREEARRLVPRQIEQSRFEELILAPMEEYYGITREEAEAIRNDSSHPLFGAGFYLRKQLAYFSFKSLDDATSDSLYQDMRKAYPVLDNMNIYVLESTASTTEIEKIEQVIKTACPNYSYEEMDYDHEQTQYTSEEENPPLFKMALEYTLDEDGFNVRLPANGLRFNESMFEVRSVKVLPYLGAGNNTYDGYAFFPDGSGALLTFEDMKIKSPNGESIATDIYGEDYAYHELEQKYQQVTRYPVYGIVENTRYYDFTMYNEVLEEDVTTTVNGVAYDIVTKAMEEGGTIPAELKDVKSLIDNAEMTERVEKRGFAVFVEEGEALSSLAYTHEGARNEYDSIALVCNPRPRDEYNLADAISVGNNTTVSVVSDRKYVGSYRMHITMLSDPDLAEKAVTEGKLEFRDNVWYESSWLGMGIAYRDYLVKKGILTPLTENDVSENIPLYIESFGAMETVEKFLSIPMEVKRPLTSADNVYTMYEELSAQGVANINFKLTGFANGGMYSKVPYKLKWEKAISKQMSMQDLFDLANISNHADEYTVSDILSLADMKTDELIKKYTGLTPEAFAQKYGTEASALSGMKASEFMTLCGLSAGEFDIFPDFDFSYATVDSMFDGFSMRKHAVRTIDDRYAFKREYMATQQRYAGYYQLAISPAYFGRFYKKLMKNYLGYDNVKGISVGSLGTALNSDVDEDEPYNRDDAKGFVNAALEYISGSADNLQVMVDGGNAYSWKFVDHILGASIDSSRYLASSYSVPFLGVVLHGYVNFTGSPLNMEGDVNYAKLKAIENGASIYFTLSYQNTQNLKEDFFLSKYYSVRYDIWFDDVVEIYNELNNELKDVQTMPIIGHEFLSGMRVPDTDELDRDLEEEFNEIMNFQGNQQAFLEQMKAEAVADARTHIATLGETIKSVIKSSLGFYAGGLGSSGAAAQYQDGNSSFLTALSNYRKAEKTYLETVEANKAGTATAEELTDATQAFEKAEKKLNKAVSDMAKNIIKISNTIAEIDELLVVAREGVELIENTPGCPQNIIDEVRRLTAEAEAIRQERMGMDFVDTSASLTLKSFLDMQYLLVIESLEGEANFNGENVVGLLEKQYLTITEEKFGLIDDSVTYIFLRYLDANKNLSDAELKAKYSLGTTPSMDGLLLYVNEILADDVEFDPALVAAGKVNDEIKKYIKNSYLLKLNSKEIKDLASAKDDIAVLATTFKYLNLNPLKHNGTAADVNNVNLYAVIDKLNDKLAGLTGNNGKLNAVTDGNYKLSDILTEEELTQFVDAVDALLESYEYEKVENNTEKGATYIEYLTPDTRKDDILSYISVYYYAKVLGKVVPKDSAVVLPVLNAKSNSIESLELLFNDRLTTYGIDTANKDFKYHDYVNAYEADLPYVRGVIAEINAQLQPYYKTDLTAVLEDTYYSIFMKYVVDKEKAPGKLDVVNAEPVEGDDSPTNKEQINAAAEALLAEKLPLVQNLNDAKALAQEIMDLHNAYTVKEDYDIEANSYAYVLNPYFKRETSNTIANVTTHKYYYDEYIAAMDAAVLSKVEEKKAIVLSQLGENYSTMDYLDVVFNVLADKNDPAYEFINEITALIPYSSSNSKRTVKDDVTEYYFYMLFNCLQSSDMGKMADLPISTETAGAASNAIKAIEAYVTTFKTQLLDKAKASVAAGEMINYSMTNFLTVDEQKQLVEAVYAFMIDPNKGNYKFDPNVDKQQILDEIMDLIKYCFYDEAFDRLNCQKLVEFNLHEIYSNSLEESYKNLKELARYYATSFSDMTSEEYDAYFIPKTTEKVDDEEEEESRYVSDDGRIVSVTYGQREGGTYIPYKTFVLNYNNFSVNVVYEGITYTIPAYGYVTVITEAP